MDIIANMDECIVCYKEFDLNENELYFLCSHRTCTDCAKKWSTSCPTCRCASRRHRAANSSMLDLDAYRYIEARMEDNARHCEISASMERILLSNYDVRVSRVWCGKRANVLLENQHNIKFFVNTTHGVGNVSKHLRVFMADIPFSITIMHLENCISVFF